ncbi:unnamed protein product [Trichobilharzia regenti]|nr:unnamed protein product [Trichobilharzia regenti]
MVMSANLEKMVYQDLQEKMVSLVHVDLQENK